MFQYKVFLFLITICVTKSEVDYETLCKNDYSDGNNNQIDVLEYCSNKLCIEKCCGPAEMLRRNKCVNKRTLFETEKRLENGESKYNSINILSSLDVTTKSKKSVVFIQNHRNFHNCTAGHAEVKDYNISEDGSLSWQHSESKKWKHIEKLKYCIEYKLVTRPHNPKADIKIIIRQTISDPQQTKEIETFETVALLISSFFLMLVLVVYCMLPDLRNLSGLVLMAYTFTLFFAFVNKLILIFIQRHPPKGFCKNFSPVVYYGFLSSFFWLSVISFDVWWGLRSFRIKRGSKRGELVKFMWYGLFAWGAPLLITAIAVTLDNIVYLDIVEPPFKDCLTNDKSLNYYFNIPIGILIFINIVLFAMTVYNIWMVKHAVNKCHDSRSSKQQNNKFSTYAKLAMMMGLSWCMELIPTIDMLWFYVLTNLYNLLTGVVIFYLFVCKKKILVQLCKKFNIRNDFTKKLESTLSQHTKSEITRTTGVASSIVKNRSKDEDQEMDLLKNCPKEESTIV